MTRFLTPYLAAQSDWVLFCDCDFLFTGDVRDVLSGLDRSKAVYCVQHEYTPANAIKMDGKTQTSYPRKNWSSFMLLNGSHPDVRALTPDIVNSSAPAYLHRFDWVHDQGHIGALDLVIDGPTPAMHRRPRAILAHAELEGFHVLLHLVWPFAEVHEVVR
jgi:hypothetical protein